MPRITRMLSEVDQPLPVAATKKRWIAQGLKLGQVEKNLEWAIATWWNAGERYKDRVSIVRDPRWEGPSYETCRAYAQTARKFESSRRLPNLSIHHHQAVQNLPVEKADRLLNRAAREAEETSKPPSVQKVRQWAKIERREEKEVEFAQKTAQAEKALGMGPLYSVIMADPPWRYETRSEQGMDRAADNHYQTMPLDKILALGPKIPAAPDCVLWLWITSPMLFKAGPAIIDAWGFEYRAHAIWTKPSQGTGYIFRSAHEVLLYCVRGNPPPPAPGTQPMSWFSAPRGRHSEKPDKAYEIVEALFPNQPKIDLFARKARPGWDVWGNEIMAAAA